jgi:hypothetical protein
MLVLDYDAKQNPPKGVIKENHSKLERLPAPPAFASRRGKYPRKKPNILLFH